MRSILALTLALAFATQCAIADDLGVDVLRAKQAEEREAAKAIPATSVGVYDVEDLLSLFEGKGENKTEKVAELIRRNVPSLRDANVSPFPSNLAVVVIATEAGHKDAKGYLAKLRDARKLLEESGFEISTN